MNFVVFFLRVSRRTALFAVLMGLLSGAGTAGLIALINLALGRADGTVGTLAWIFSGMCLLVLVTNVVSQRLLIHLAQGTLLNLRRNLIRQILEAPLRRMEQVGTPRILASLTDDVFVITNGLLALPKFCIDVIVVLGCVVYLGWLSRPVFLSVLGFIGMGILSYWYLVGRAAHAFTMARDGEDTLFRHFRALTDGIKELKLHEPRRHGFLSQFHTTAASLKAHTVKALTIHTVAGNWGHLLFLVLIGLLLFLVPNLSSVNRDILTGYTLTVLYLMSPLETIMAVIPVLTQATVSLRKITDLGLSLSSSLPECEGPRSMSDAQLGRSWTQLDMVEVTHTYQRESGDDKFSVGPLDLTLVPGQVVFLSGGNGSGKTTLAKLLTGLYRPETGMIRLNGVPITDENLEWYRQHFSAVFSDFYLFDSLLGIWTPDITEQGQHYLEQLQLNHKVRIDQGAFSTTELSRGQRKRLALLTAILEDRPIYVFDEWAADQDPEFKSIFYSKLVPQLKQQGKAVLVITHDDRYFHIADRLLKMEQGVIREGVLVP